MTFGKMKPVATIVAQFAAGVEVEAISHDGKMFLPIVSMGEFIKDEKPSPVEKPSKKVEPVIEYDDAEKEEEKKTSCKVYTEDELMDMDSKEIEKILKNTYGIDPSESAGKNTNKKLRKLLLDAQETAKNEDEEKTVKKSKKDEEEAHDDAEDDDDLSGKVGDLLEKFDAGSLNKKKTIAKICELVDDADANKVGSLVSEFEDDTDADIDEASQKIADALLGRSSKKSTKKSSKKSKEELIDPSDLKVGDRVSVWWDDEDNKEWYDGEVKAIKKGKVLIAYDDETEEYIDEEIHTKVKKLGE